MKPLKLFLAGAFLFSLTSVTFSYSSRKTTARFKQIGFGKTLRRIRHRSASLRREFALYSKTTPATVTVTFLLLPGQTLKLYDPYYDFVKMTSDFPVALHGANCNSDGPTDFDCRNIPSDRYLIIDDSRIGISPDSSPANRVKFVAVHHRATD